MAWGGCATHQRHLSERVCHSLPPIQLRRSRSFAEETQCVLIEFVFFRAVIVFFIIL